MKTLAAIGILYAAVSFVAFRLRHPAFTETQVAIHWKDAFLWK